MATYTDNYKLKKPAPEDFADIADLNENADKIDAALKDKADLDESGKLKEDQLPSLSYIPTSQKGAAGGVASLGADGKVPSGQLPAMDYIPTSQRAQREALQVWALTARSLRDSFLRSTIFLLRRRPQRTALRPLTRIRRSRSHRFPPSAISLPHRKARQAV